MKMGQTILRGNELLLSLSSGLFLEINIDSKILRLIGLELEDKILKLLWIGRAPHVLTVWARIDE